MRVFTVVYFLMSAMVAASAEPADNAVCTVEPASMAFEVKCGGDDGKLFFFKSKRSDGKYLYGIESNDKEQLLFDSADLESGVYIDDKGRAHNFEI